MNSTSEKSPSVADINERMEQDRAAVGETLSALRVRLHDDLQWRRLLAERPWLTAAGTGLVGVLLGRSARRLVR